MASAHLNDDLTCSICLNIYTEPITLRCGHNFCRECIDQVLGLPGQYRCPECRAEFAERPALQRNISLHNIAERFRSAYPDLEDAAISCTYCIHAAVVAFKFCIQCEAALCEEHLKVHIKSPEHILVEPNCSLEARRCPMHKIPENYFMQDASCMGLSCSLIGEHVGDKVVPRSEENSALREISEQEEQESTSEMTQQPRMKKDKIPREMGHVEEDLERNAHHDENICNTGNYEQSINGGHVAASDPEEVLVWTMLRKRLSNLNNYLRNFCSHKESPPEPCQRVNRGIKDLLLDIDTAGVYVEILEGLRTVLWSGGIHSYPKTMKRFRCSQVLSITSFDSGKHKWKLETSRDGDWRLGVSYGRTARRGFQSIIGNNQKSWCLLRSKRQYSVIHNEREIQLGPKPSCCLIGIVLDYDAERLTFYELGNPIRHLYSFTANFTEPLHAAVWIYNAWVRIRLYDYVSRDPSAGPQ